MSSVKFENVTATAKANIYFDGKVVSHSIDTADGEKKTLGIIYPGNYHFGTELAEEMVVVAGKCTVQIDGSEDCRTYSEGDAFKVPANSGFDITVTDQTFEYICSFIS